MADFFEEHRLIRGGCRLLRQNWKQLSAASALTVSFWLLLKYYNSGGFGGHRNHNGGGGGRNISGGGGGGSGGNGGSSDANSMLRVSIEILGRFERSFKTPVMGFPNYCDGGFGIATVLLR